MDWLAKSMTVSVAMQKYGALSTNSMVRGKWNPTSCPSAGFSLGRRKDVYCVSYILTQRRIYVSAKSTFLRCTGLKVGSAVRNCHKMRTRVPPELIDSSGETLVFSLFK